MNLKKIEKKFQNIFLNFFFKIFFLNIPFFPIFFQIHKIYHLGLLCTNFQCSGIIFNFFQIWPTDKKVCYLFFWLYTINLKKVFKYTQSLVSKTTWTFLKNSTALGFSKKISKNEMKTCMGCHENLKKIKMFTWF